ncbi:kinase-regulated stress-responsive transcription factor skn7 [Schistosoma haematobium]|uniref:Kinase-regulated stress-responsive transcription factor skn7 n=1 Tax=Schistosoma haematobium TaxID=6185 RepID=A0A922LM89_SCHHA|nr:kinase-regulated stress-responsive transcription factor skn7 [Schistosoma haematobium]KAH9589647.1 kinase-regulated stress-responsive transcription factor skn7 [Schistosoma haematobium]
MNSMKMIGFDFIIFISLIMNEIGFCMIMDNYSINNQSKLHNPSKTYRYGVFRQTSLLVCLPDLMQLHCPTHMYIRTLEIEVFHSFQTTQEPEFISPSCSFKTNQPEKKRKHELNIKRTIDCNNKLNIVKMIKQMCEGRKNCELHISQLIPNLTQCSEENSSILIKYQCLPDLDSALSEAICTDTYMEVKCNTERSINTLVILNAKFEKEIKLFDSSSTYECPIVPTEIPIGLSNNVCSSTIDITDYLSSSCDGHSTCSVNPNTIDLSMNKIQKCGKMHLSLVYVCVPPELIITKHFIDTNNERHTEKQKTNQRQPKEIQTVRQGNKIHTLNPSDVSSYEKSHLSLIKTDIEQNKKKVFIDPRKSINIQMNTRTNELLYKHQEPYVQSINPSLLQSLLIGIGSGLLILFSILFIIILLYRKYNQRRTTEIKSKSNKCSTICFSHTNDDWSTINSNLLHNTSSRLEIPITNDIKCLCSICKLPINSYSIINDLHKYHNEHCQCHINTNISGNINHCNVNHEHYDGKSCCITGHHQNISDLYGMKIITPTLNQSPCIFNVCPLDTSNDINSTLLPLNTNTINSENSKNTINDYMPTITTTITTTSLSLSSTPSSINSIHYEYHRSSSLDHKFQSNHIYNTNYINTSQSINSNSTRYGYDINNEINDHHDECLLKFNHYHRLLKCDRKIDYDHINEHRLRNNNNDNNNNNNNIITDHCQYEMKTIPSEIINKEMIRSPSNNFTDQINIDNCIESFKKYNENKSIYEINSLIQSTLQRKEINPQEYGCNNNSNNNNNNMYLLKKNDNHHHQQQLHNEKEINQQINKKEGKQFLIHDPISRCNSSLDNESIESLAISLIDPPQNFRTSINELHLINNNNHKSSMKVTITPTHKPPDVILKSGNYHDEVDLERPPPKMPPLRGILTNRSIITERNTAF